MTVMAIVLSGKELAAAIKQDASRRILELKNRFGIVPGLALVLIGSNEDSRKYVELKAKQCRDAGAVANIHKLDERISPQELSKHIEGLNRDPNVHGILIQLPIPELLNDILDGLFPNNLLSLWLFVVLLNKDSSERVLLIGRAIWPEHCLNS